MRMRSSRQESRGSPSSSAYSSDNEQTEWMRRIGRKDVSREEDVAMRLNQQLAMLYHRDGGPQRSSRSSLASTTSSASCSSPSSCTSPLNSPSLSLHSSPCLSRHTSPSSSLRNYQLLQDPGEGKGNRSWRGSKTRIIGQGGGSAASLISLGLKEEREEAACHRRSSLQPPDMGSLERLVGRDGGGKLDGRDHYPLPFHPGHAHHNHLPREGHPGDSYPSPPRMVQYPTTTSNPQQSDPNVTPTARRRSLQVDRDLTEQPIEDPRYTTLPKQTRTQDHQGTQDHKPQQQAHRTQPKTNPEPTINLANLPRTQPTINQKNLSQELRTKENLSKDSSSKQQIGSQEEDDRRQQQKRRSG